MGGVSSQIQRRGERRRIKEEVKIVQKCEMHEMKRLTEHAVCWVGACQLILGMESRELQHD